ncbi:PucR family transcriptional regulator [Kineococcus glutinatus]|uniref:PucR family transcriptional regulator n=1 Tax=Kineococcus glutinatus TaxID=1070872 RepID=A0ABP9H6T3_9ACTN
MRRLLGAPELGLRQPTTVPEDALDAPVSWAHSSDLADPTPFLSAGQALLTTGAQFAGDPATGPGADAFDGYVARLVRAGVPALGFGTGVVVPTVPAALVTACAAAGLPLLEVPYRTPFIAVVRWVADAVAAEEGARTAWALRAQGAVSAAALGKEGLRGALRTLAEHLGRTVQLWNGEGELEESHPPAPAADAASLAGTVAALLTRGQRATASAGLGAAPGGQRLAHLQTLGRRNQLRGVLAVVGDGDLDAPARGVVTSVVALAELSLEQGRTLRRAVRVLRAEALRLLLEDRLDAAERVVEALGERLPAEPVRVVVLVPQDRTAARVEDALDVRAAATGGPFHARAGDRVVVVTGADDVAGLEELCRRLRVAAAASAPTPYARTAMALEQARRLAAQLGPGASGVRRAEAEDNGLLGILLRADAGQVARERLAGLLAEEEGRALLGYAAVWLSHHGRWEPAARQLGLHRHSLRARIERLQEVLGYDFERFTDRAELWALLSALNLEPGPPR